MFLIESAQFQSPIGLLSILAFKEGVVKISFKNESSEEKEKWCQSYLGMGLIKRTDFALLAKDQILKYLSGRRKSLDFPIVHFNSSFHKKVLEVIRQIPYGETRSYGEIAKMVNKPKASRAVGGAHSNNPLPLYYPCHRIICTDGSLGGFGGGTQIKQFLLELERKNS